MDTSYKKNMRVTGKKVKRKAASSRRPRKERQIQIQYTPAKPFNRNRFLLRLATVAAVVVALVLGMSIFFKASKVVVSGADKYTPWEIKEASGIQDGDALLSISETKISARIRTQLPYVGNVRVGIKLPDTVNIEITELDAVYAVEDSDQGWWLIDAQGRIVEKITAPESKLYPQIQGVQIQSSAVGQQAAAAVEETTGEATTEATGVTVPTEPAVQPKQQLDCAIQILTALESNGILGQVKTINVLDVKQLSIQYADRYQVTLGDAARLEYKIAAMKAAIQKMGDYQSGHLDVSFTTWPDQVGYTPSDGE